VLTPARSRLAWNTSWSTAASSAKPSICWGPRSLPAWGSMATSSTPSTAASARMVVDRPLNDPISTMREPGSSAAARSHSRRAWPSVIHPSTSATAATASAKDGRVTMPTDASGGGYPPRVAAGSKIGDLAAGAGIRRIHLLSWRDLDDVEAGGSEVHAATVARFWAEAGLEVTLRTSFAQGQAPVVVRDGYRVIRRAGRYLVFPRAVGSELLGRHGPRDALVEIWNGMPFFSPLWAKGPRVVVLHHVHAEMWKMVLGDDAPWAAALGNVVVQRVAPLAFRTSRIVTLSQSSRDDIIELLHFRP